VAGSLLLNTEAGFTVLLARAFYREPITKQMMLALTSMTLGGFVLALTSESSGAAIQWAGAAAVAAATLAWALDNTLTRPLAHQDSTRIVALKSAFGVLLTFAASRGFREPVPLASSILALGLCGAASYGLSLRFYVQAQRTLGAARTASVFALAPFIGALLAALSGDRSIHLLTWLAAPLFAVGVWLHLRERHDHVHVHERTEHEHAHRHDDGHHDHTHPFAVTGEHVHPHRHDRVEHEHAHGLDEAHDHHGKTNT
jgi:drug/metabolite transporter (DMT)-like permease